MAAGVQAGKRGTYTRVRRIEPHRSLLKNRAQSALVYNSPAQSWPEIARLARYGQRHDPGDFAQPGRGRTVTNQAIVDTIVERIVTHFQPARILLFGSRAVPAIAGATSTCSSSWTM